MNSQLPHQSRQLSQSYPIHTQISTLASKSASPHINIQSPSDIVFSTSRCAFVVANLGNNEISIIDQSGQYLKSSFGQTYPQGSHIKLPKSLDGVSTKCMFNQPHGLALSEDASYIFVADTGNHSIRIIDIDNQMCSTVAGDFTKKGGLQVGDLDQTLLEEPRGLCLDPKGNIITTTKSAVVYLDLEQQSSYVISGEANFGFRDGYIQTALFDHPDGVVGLEGGILIVADTYNHRIRVIDQQEQKVSTLSGNGEPGYLDGPCLQARFNFPQKLALVVTEDSKMLYVTELNDCVRAIDLIQREVITLCGGQGRKSGFEDGNGRTALFNFPYGITTTDSGRALAITESDNHSIRLIDILSTCQQSLKSERAPQFENRVQLAPPKSQKFSSTTLSMLVSVAQASASVIDESIFDQITDTYASSPPQSQELVRLLGRCLGLALNIQDIVEGNEELVFNDKYALLDNITLSDPTQIGEDQLEELREEMELLSNQSQVKQPGVRSVHQWLLDFQKAASYKINDDRKNNPKLPQESKKTVQANKPVLKDCKDGVSGSQKQQQTKSKETPRNKSSHINQLAQPKKQKTALVHQQKQHSQKAKSQRVKSPKAKEQQPQLEQLEIKNKQVEDEREPKEEQTLTYEQLVMENQQLKRDNQKLVVKVEQMKSEFLEMSTMMEQIIHDRVNPAQN